jgi:hypothetical protein
MKRCVPAYLRKVAFCSSVGWILTLTALTLTLRLPLTLYERRAVVLGCEVGEHHDFVEFCGTSVASMIFNDREN